MPVMAYNEALNHALREELRRDESVFLMGEDIAVWGGAYRVTAGLLDEFGEKRVKDTPIAEEAIIGMGIGSAMVGLRPVCEIMTVNFLLVAIDQVVNNAAKMRYMFGGQITLPLTIRMAHGGGHQLGAQHSQNLEVWFAHVPGLKVVAPATPADAKGLLKAAIRDDNPVIFMENEALYMTKGEVPEGEYVIPLGKSEVTRPGADLTIVSFSRMALVALKAAEQLAQSGVEAEVIDLRTLRPLDMAPVLASARKTGRVLVAEEGWRSFGVGAEVASRIYEEAFDYLDAPIGRVGGPEVPMPFARPLEIAAIPDLDDILQAARKVLA